MRYLISTICIVLLMWGCDRSVDATAQPKLVRKKLVAQKEKVAEVSPNQTVRKGKKTATIKVDKAKAKKQPIPKTKTDRQTVVAKKIEAAPVEETARKPIKQKKPAVRPRSDISEIQRPPSGDKDAPSDKLIAATSNVTRTTKPATLPGAYDAIGKIDPFEPLFRDKPVSVDKKAKPKKRMPLTPLERIDLSQLKLVGIITASSGNRALVEESTGKGYVIKTGTYIGMNSGKVVTIRKEKVVVEEEFEDVFGKTKLRQREIKLPKPPGEF